MMGHDVAPHIHETSYAETADHVIIPSPMQPSNTSLSGLFSGLRHNCSVNAFIYTVSLEQQSELNLDVPEPIEEYTVHYRLQWHANRKKQRFRDDQPALLFQRFLRLFSHRGPPVA